MGNIYGTWGGSEGGLPSVATGSHTDAIPLSGKFDGTLGVLGGIAAVAALRQAVRPAPAPATLTITLLIFGTRDAVQSMDAQSPSR